MSASGPAPRRPEEAVIATRDGWRLAASVFEPPAGDAPAPSLIVFPAMAAAARSYQRMAAHLAGRGYRVLAVDPRGVGRSRPLPSRRVDFGVDALLDEDWPAVVAWVRRRAPDAPVALVGHSLGGQLSAVYAGRHREQIAALVLLTTSFVHYRLWPLPHSVLIHAVYRSFPPIARALGHFPGDRLGFGHRVARQLICDWARWGRSGRYLGSDGRDLDADLARAALPVLSVSFSDDWWFGPRAAVDAFAQRLGDAKLTRWHLAPGELGLREAGHFAHLRRGRALWDRIADWLGEAGLRPA